MKWDEYTLEQRMEIARGAFTYQNHFPRYILLSKSDFSYMTDRYGDDVKYWRGMDVRESQLAENGFPLVVMDASWRIP